MLIPDPFCEVQKVPAAGAKGRGFAPTDPTGGASSAPPVTRLSSS